MFSNLRAFGALTVYADEVESPVDVRRSETTPPSDEDAGDIERGPERFMAYAHRIARTIRSGLRYGVVRIAISKSSPTTVGAGRASNRVACVAGMLPIPATLENRSVQWQTQCGSMQVTQLLAYTLSAMLRTTATKHSSRARARTPSPASSWRRQCSRCSHRCSCLR